MCRESGFATDNPNTALSRFQIKFLNKYWAKIYVLIVIVLAVEVKL